MNLRHKKGADERGKQGSSLVVSIIISKCDSTDLFTLVNQVANIYEVAVVRIKGCK